MAIRAVSISAVLAACGSHAAPPPSTAPPQHGVFVADLDRSVDPCTDFYEYANGSWRKDNPIPAAMPRWSRRWQAGETAKDRLKDILDEVSARTDWPHASVEQLIGDLYGGCMDQAAIDRRGLAPIAPLLAAIDEVREPGELGRVIAQLAAIGTSAPFAIGGGSDYHTPTKIIAWVGSAGLGLPDRDYYLKPEPRFVEARAKYLAHVAAMFALAGSDATAAKHAADTVMAFERGLATATLDNVAARDPAATDHTMSLAELQQLTPRFDWPAFFQASGVQLTSLNVNEPAFLTEVERQLEVTPIADWKIYLRWQLLSGEAPALAQRFVDESFAFNQRFLGGVAEMKPRWKQCVEATDAQLGEALGKKYVDRYFPPAAKARVRRMVENVLAAVKDSIEQLAWMSPATKQRALQKLATVNPKIGYPDKWKDYRSVAVRRDHYWESQAAARAWNVRDNLATIGKPLDRGRWAMTPPTSNAYYNAALNEIVFPAGGLQSPAFSLDAVDAVNYGAIGVGIGHEISHGFDDQGAKFDAQGRLDNWWSPDDLASFEARGQCVVDQFDHYFVEPELHHNGKLVLGEAIGDLGGANIAFRAFQKAKQQTPAPTLDGFTPDQQFFIAWGQFRGDAIRPETQRRMIQGDPHPIAKFRVIGPLSNIPAFQAAFACKADSAMVRPPAQRCEIW